jgi:hypothetical protein
VQGERVLSYRQQPQTDTKNQTHQRRVVDLEHLAVVDAGLNEASRDVHKQTHARKPGTYIRSDAQTKAGSARFARTVIDPLHTDQLKHSRSPFPRNESESVPSKPQMLGDSLMFSRVIPRHLEVTTSASSCAADKTGIARLAREQQERFTLFQYHL